MKLSLPHCGISLSHWSKNTWSVHVGLLSVVSKILWTPFSSSALSLVWHGTSEYPYLCSYVMLYSYNAVYVGSRLGQIAQIGMFINSFIDKNIGTCAAQPWHVFSTRKTIPSVWPRDCFDGHVVPGSLLLPNPSVFGSLELIWGGLWSQYSLDLIGQLPISMILSCYLPIKWCVKSNLCHPCSANPMFQLGPWPPAGQFLHLSYLSHPNLYLF